MPDVNVLAGIRPDSWGLPLFLHLIGAMVLVGALATAIYYLFAARRNDSLDSVRTGFKALLYGALPAWLVMRGSAQWIANKEGLEDSDQVWITLGFIISEGGFLVLAGGTLAAGLIARRAGVSGGSAAESRGIAITSWALTALIAAYIVAVWAMTSKPI